MFLAEGGSVGHCVHCMTTLMRDATVTVRIPATEKADLMASSKLMGRDYTRVAADFIMEGLRRRKYPAIEFRDGEPGGRIAYLAASRWPVWLVVDLVNDCGGNLEQAAKHMGRPAALIKMALRFAADHPAEIAAAQRLADLREKEAKA